MIDFVLADLADLAFWEKITTESFQHAQKNNSGKKYPLETSWRRYIARSARSARTKSIISNTYMGGVAGTLLGRKIEDPDKMNNIK